jgi:DNA-binding beta-propeller fold protein YncE
VRVRRASVRIGRVAVLGCRVTAVGRTLWVSVYGPGDVVRLDPSTGKIVRRYRVGGGPGSLAVAGGSVWIGNYVGSTLIRLDPRHRRVRHVVVGGQPIAVGSVGNAVWTADKGDGRVTKLSARTGKILLRRSFPSESHEGLFATATGIWVTSEGGIVHELDPATGKTKLTVRVGDDADYVLAAGGSIWVSCYLDDHVWRLDPATGRVVQRLEVGTGAQGMALQGSTLWVANYDTGRVLRVDITTGRVLKSIKAGRQPRAVALAGGSVWVANSGGSTVARIPAG